MISKIKIENYRGISESREISFIANAKRNANKDGVVKTNGKEILLSSSLMGKNASGKSSFIKGIQFITNLSMGVLYKRTLRNLQIYEKPTNIKENINFKIVIDKIIKDEFNDYSKPIKTSIEFIDLENIINLSLEIDNKGIVKEIITKNDEFYSMQEENVEFFKSNIFNKDLNFTRITFSYEPFFFHFSLGKLFKNKKVNKDFILSWLKISDDKIQKIIWTSKNDIEGFIIKHDDLIEKQISFSELSSGTKKWFSIATWLFKALYVEQAFIYIDEIDTSLHAGLIIFLLIIINDKKINIKKSQIFFTSHSPLIIEKPFRKDAINYINEMGKIINLDSLQIREDLSITKNFISEKISSHPMKSDMFDFLEDLDE